MNPILTTIVVTAFAILAGAPAPATLERAPATMMPRASENEIKAAFLYNFARLVEWPDGVLDEGEMTLCFTGSDDAATSLVSYDRKLVGHRRLTVRRIEAGGQGGCNMFYLAGSGVDSVLSAVQSESVLTVGEMPGFTDMGGIINFTILDNKLRFQVNEAAAERVGLKIGSQLLRAAIEA